VPNCFRRRSRSSRLPSLRRPGFVSFSSEAAHTSFERHASRVTCRALSSSLEYRRKCDLSGQRRGEVDEPIGGRVGDARRFAPFRAGLGEHEVVALGVNVVARGAWCRRAEGNWTRPRERQRRTRDDEHAGSRRGVERAARRNEEEYVNELVRAVLERRSHAGSMGAVLAPLAVRRGGARLVTRTARRERRPVVDDIGTSRLRRRARAARVGAAPRTAARRVAAVPRRTPGWRARMMNRLAARAGESTRDPE